MEENVLNKGSFEDELNNFINPKYENHPSVTGDDEDKVATIVSSRFADTKYGRKLLLELKFDSGEQKVAFLSKTWAKEFVKKAGKPPWNGKRVKIEMMPVLNPSKHEIIRKPFPNPVM